MQQPQTVILNVGVSGSGKTTWSKQFLKDNPGYLRINRDDIRKFLVGNELEGYYQRKDNGAIENIVTMLEQQAFDQLIIRKFSVIVDNTNLKQSYINNWLNRLNKIGDTYEMKFDVKFKIIEPEKGYFDSLADVCKARVLERDQMPESRLLDYIDKQAESFEEIKKYLIKTYPNQILE